MEGPIRIFSGRYPDQAELIRKTILDAPPSTAYPPLVQVMVGRDGTIWLASTLRGAVPATERKWTVLAPKGDPLGTVSVPLNVVIQDADRSSIWAIESLSDAAVGSGSGAAARVRAATVVRYRVTFPPGVP